MKKNDRKVLVPFDDFTIPEKCEMDMLQIWRNCERWKISGDDVRTGKRGL